MWTHFRALAIRIGLSREQVEAVERGGVPTLVQDPVHSEISYRVRPDPDWTQRMGEAWDGTLVNSRRESAGTLPIPDGRMRIAEVSLPERGVTAHMVPGEYEVIVTIAHMGSEETYDHAEYVSHAFALLRGREDVALIEPMTAQDGTEHNVDAPSTAFAGEGALELIAASRPGGRIGTIYDVIRSATPDSEVSERHWARAVTDDGSGALIVVNAGRDREDYPLFRIADPDGNTIGVMLDFFVDNRPH